MTQTHLAVILKVVDEIMNEKGKHKLTLYQPETYQIKVSGKLDEDWSDWAGEMTVKFRIGDKGLSITSLTGPLDQAALQGLLRRLYALGFPLISLICLDFN